MKESAIKGLVTKLNKELDKLKSGEVLVKKNLHSEVYHRANGVSNSKLKLFISCPRKYQARYITGESEQKQNKAFDLGKAAHGLILEPEKFNSEFIRQPDDIAVRRGKAWDAFKDANPNKVIITGEDWTHCFGIRDAVLRHHFGARLLSGGRAEVSFFKRDATTGLIIKCRPDYMLGDLITDVKTAASSEPEAFGKHAASLLYHMQDAIYRDITGLPDFAFLAVEKEPPYVVTAPIMFDDDARQIGHAMYRDALGRLADAIDFNVFEGYSNKPVVISLKPWDKKKFEHLEQIEYEESASYAA
ncbi:PD-(D/E)XK nuclease-like domain-containing protein [Shewanella avicenniae]|uniref:PD-(D/E)XK nuclease-like domain-containing protein n=1 Tax=Shewanella avicenniae TaxID=2814294 RepID=A0ABX7QM13_9GAMM|nr:PD-(D/E)XK nuclease-like domain-containing protein [Shewanella avicenniae]QSX32491.1 PD-(D/E)XK nuclease-like domain-containing protein [Shewanella avicenniae]